MIEKILRASWKIKLIKTKKKFKHFGKNIWIGNNFEIIHPEYISIGDNFAAESFLRIQAWKTNDNGQTKKIPAIEIGDNVSLMSNCQVSCVSNITIGSGCLFGDNVFITDNFHGNPKENDKDVLPRERPLYSKGGVKIGNNVWLGRNVCVMPGVTIGNGAIVAANAVVTHDVGPNEIVAGVPAVKIHYHNEK